MHSGPSRRPRCSTGRRRGTRYPLGISGAAISAGSRAASECLRQLRGSPPPCARRSDAILWESDSGETDRHLTYRELHEARVPTGQRTEASRRPEGRPDLHLPADDPRGRRRHAGLRAHRRNPLHRFRRILGRGLEGPHPGRRVRIRDLCRRRTPRRQAHRPETERRSRAGILPQCEDGFRGPAHRRAHRLGDTARHRLPTRRVAGRSGRPAKPRTWMPRTRCSSCTPPGLPASPRASCTPPVVICCIAAITHRYVFDYREGDIYWCTADVGWVTGHSYLVYGPLCNGATTLLFEGVPTYPDPSRLWAVIDKHRVNIFYTAPTVIRSLMGLGDHWVTETRRDSLRILGSVGEPINPEAWEWYYHVVGECALPNRRHLVADGDRRHHDHPAAGCHAAEARLGDATVFRGRTGDSRRPGNGWSRVPEKVPWSSQPPGPARPAPFSAITSASSKPIFRPIPATTSPVTAPAATRTATTGSPGASTTSSTFPDTGWAPQKSKARLVLHDDVAEAAVVGYPHNVKGQGIYAFVTPIADVAPTDELKRRAHRTGAQRKLAPSPPRITSSSRRLCPKRGPARSCGGSCEK